MSAPPPLPFDPAAVRAHIKMLHNLASEYDGIIPLCIFGENPDSGRKFSIVQHFAIGDVDGMVNAALTYENHPDANVYAPLAVMRRDLPPREKGGERDVIAVLGGVLDSDADRREEAHAPVEPNYIVQSSAVPAANRQEFILFDRPLPPSEAKPLVEALSRASGGDAGTKDISHVWRVPGTASWPNRKKVLERNRPREPQPVRVLKAWDGSLTSVDELRTVLSPHMTGGAKPNGHAQRDATGDVAAIMATLGAGLRKLIAAPPMEGEDRSKTLASVVTQLLYKGLSDGEIQAVIEAHPQGVGAKYVGRPDLAKEIERLRGKFAGTADAPSDGPIPLFPPLPPAQRFPIESLGPVLSRAAAAISRKVQVPGAIAAQSVLAVAALAAQAHADVRLPYGQTRPLSLFFVTVAASGDRKSTADNEALWPIRKREKALKEDYEREHRTWLIASAAWNAEKKKIESDRKIGFEARKHALGALGPEPEQPLHPFLTAPEPTIEGLVKAWVNAPAALGVFSAEGGMFIGGHGMSQDNRLRTAASYSELWDGHPIKRVRAHDGVTILHGRRLSMHLMVQPEAAAQFLADPLLRDQGLLSRILVAAPDSIAGSRLYRDPSPADEAAIRAYGARILSILEAPWPLAKGRRNELQPRTLRISDDAVRAWRAFYDHVEWQCGADRELQSIRDFAAKAAEHAARIAGVLTIVDNVHADAIGMGAMGPALTLADWYVNETLRLQRVGRTDARLLRAQQLLDWMRGRRDAVIGFREIVQFGPALLRVKVSAEEALSILKTHGWIVEVSGRPRRVRLASEEPAS